MNKIFFDLAVGIGLVVSLAAAPSALASPIVIQTLPTPEMTAAQFNTLFTPIGNAPALSSTYQYLDSPVSGVVRSQVFQGQGAASGLYAYAYQVGVANASDNSGTPLHTDSISFRYNATPLGTDLTKSGHTAFAYAITNGSIGGLVPPSAGSGMSIQVPEVSWQPEDKVGNIRAKFVDAPTSTPPLQAGADSGTFIVLSKQLFNQQYVNFQSANPTTGDFAKVYAATGGQIAPVPIPEPITILAWGGMAGATLLVRRVRGTRAAS